MMSIERSKAEVIIITPMSKSIPAISIVNLRPNRLRVEKDCMGIEIHSFAQSSTASKSQAIIRIGLNVSKVAKRGTLKGSIYEH